MQTSRYEMTAHPLLEPVIILPSQFFTNAAGDLTRKSGEHKLLWAVLADAVHCFQKFVHATTRRRQRLFDEARLWIMQSDAQTGGVDQSRREGFTFDEVCNALGLDAEYLRDGLRRWQEAQESGRASHNRAAAGSDVQAIASAGIMRESADRGHSAAS